MRTPASTPSSLLEVARKAVEAAGAVVPHTDADGLAAGAIALRLRGQGADAAVLLGRGENPFNHRDRLPEGRVAVLDWGIRRFAGSAVFVDHHAPEVDLSTMSADQVVVSGYAEGRPVSTAVLMRRLAPEAPAWLAAVGGVGDYGDEAFGLPECSGAAKTAVKKVVALVNAPRRLPAGPVRTALALLVEHDDPKALLKDARVKELESAKAEYRAGFEAAVRTAPVVGGGVALIRFSSPYQVHPLVAQTWARRLAPRAVIAANDGYLPGRVNFAVRGGREADDLRALLKAGFPEAAGVEEFAKGHDRATGGSLTREQFERLIAALGVGARS